MTSIELRHLRQFVAVAEELHFGRAARRLHMTQPPITVAIRQFEHNLGVALFVRDRRSVALTPVGDALLPPVRQLLKDADDLLIRAQAAATGLTGRLRLAFVSSVSYGPLPEWLRSFRESHPGLTLNLREATLDVQLVRFAEGDLDAGFMLHAPHSPPPGVVAMPVIDEPMVLAVPEGHRFTQPTRLRFSSVAHEPLVTFPRSSAPSLFDAVVGAYQLKGITPTIVQEVIQLQTIVNLVSAGIGVAWVPRTMTALQRPGVVYLPVQGAGLRCQTSLVWRDPPSPVVRRFIDHVRARPSR